MIFIFGAGSGLGAGLLHSFQDHEAVFGFSRRGIAYDSFQSGKNHRFDVCSESDLNHFASVWDLFWQKSSKAPNQSLTVYFLQGSGLFKEIQQISRTELESHFQLNLFSSFYILQKLTERIQKLGKTTIVFANSTASRQGFAESTAYCASKHASAGLVRALREEWKPFGIKVINLFMGAVATEIWDDRPEFSKSEMVQVEDACEYLKSLSYLPESLFVDELFVTPRKGIL